MNDADRVYDTPEQPFHGVATTDLRAEGRMLIVARHGDAGDKGRWEGPDRLRPLSPAGRRQAEGLVIRLEDYPVEQILSSPTLRCRQTVEPLARDRLLQIEPVAALGVDAGLAQVRSVFWDRRLDNAVLCTHGETISQLFAQLALDGLEIEEPLDWPKARPGCSSAARAACVPATCLRWRLTRSSHPD